MKKNQIKKRISFNFGGESLIFDVNQSLFSSYSVDEGTKILLNSLRKNSKLKYGKILDLGCGYGTLGIFLKKQNPLSEVQCVDRDVLAVEFTKHNSEINNCKIKSYPSLDYELIEDKFDLIITNFPAKVGVNVIKKFVWNASKFLTKNGTFAIVIVKELEKEFNSILREGIEISYAEKKPKYLIYHIKYNQEISFDEEAYFRSEMIYKMENKKYLIKTVRNVPEFDKISYQTELINELLKQQKTQENVGIINPFQGHLAISVENYLTPKNIDLISRDLLQLKISKENLKRNNFSNFKVHATIELPTKGDFLIWTFDKDENLELILEKINLFKKKYKKIIICDDKKIIEKIIKKEKIKSVNQKEKNNFVSVLF